MQGQSMKRTWPIIAVSDVVKSSAWYADLLNAKNNHPDGKVFDQILDEDETVLVCLHHWGHQVQTATTIIRLSPIQKREMSEKAFSFGSWSTTSTLHGSGPSCWEHPQKSPQTSSTELACALSSCVTPMVIMWRSTKHGTRG